MKHILIIDDEFLIRYSLSHMLKSDTIQVTTATRGGEAFRELAERSFSLCCCDIHLPDMNGLKIMNHIRSSAPRTKIIMMTGGEVTGEMLQDIQQHAELLLSKPFDLFKVKSFVDRLLSSDAGPAAEAERRFQYWFLNDQRKHERRRIEQQVHCEAISPGRHQEQSAEVIDISEGGICLLTRTPLPAQALIRIVDDRSRASSGVIRWSCCGNSHLYRTGIQFIAESPHKSP